VPDHNVWALRPEWIEKNDGQPPWRFMGHNIGFVVSEGWDVHSLEDVQRTEAILRLRGWRHGTAARD